MLNECRNPFNEQLQTVYERLSEAAAADPTVDPVTIMDRGRLPARLVAGRNTLNENIPKSIKVGGLVVDTAYSSNVKDIILCLRALANNENNPRGLQ